MAKSKKLETIANRWDSEISLLTWLATSVSVFSFLFYFQRGEVLLYGDAVAHINIARRVFDSKTPGLLQLGTVWLPLPHLLMIPFIISMKMWRTGAGGSIPSMGAYVFGVAGIFRLTRDALSRGPSPDSIGASRGLVCSGRLCRQSESDLYAVDRHGRVGLPGFLHLGRALFP